MIVNKIASSVDPDEMAHEEPSHMDLHCLHRYLCCSTGLKGLRNNDQALYSIGSLMIYYHSKRNTYPTNNINPCHAE